MEEFGPLTEQPKKKTPITMKELAQDATTQVIARYAMILCAAMLPVGGWIGTTIANRGLTALDNIVDEQQKSRTEVSKLRVELAIITANYNSLNARLDTSERTVNGRVDQLSGWYRQLNDSLDKIKEIVYPLVRRQN